jgi:hypothetical protein
MIELPTGGPEVSIALELIFVYAGMILSRRLRL